MFDLDAEDNLIVHDYEPPPEHWAQVEAAVRSCPKRALAIAPMGRRVSMTRVAAEDFHFDPFAPEAMADPLPFYKVLRDHFPAYFLEQYEAWAISRFEDVWNVLHDTEGHITSTEGTMMFQEQLRHKNGGIVPAAGL